jgi:two-component system, cell cycle sensor histidine kinase and response regulator CckA
MTDERTGRLSNFFHEAGLLDRLAESIPGLVYVYDLVEDRNVFTNRPLAELLGYSPDQMGALGSMVLTNTVHPEDLPKVREHHGTMRRLAAEQVVEIEYRVQTREGNWRWLHSWESALTRDEAGNTRQFVGIAHDVTDRVRAEEELRGSQRQLAESEQRWRSIAENPFDFVVVVDRNYKYTFVNFVAPGLEMEALLGKATPFDFVSKNDHAAMQAAFDAVFNEARATSYDVYVPTLDKWYTSLVGPILDGNVVTHASVLTREITTEKRMQEQARRAEQHVRVMEAKLAQSTKLEAVGQLAGGIAHDFNNLLTGLSGVAELLSDNPSLDAEARADVEDLRRAVARGAGLTRQLLAFSRKQPLTPTQVDLSQLLDETARMLRRLIREDIEIEFPPSAEPLTIRGDRTQIEQVLINLALNARDAMPSGGRLRFSVAPYEIDGEASREHPDVQPGSYVRLSVQDSGVGMDATTLTRIFEPFFTTKPIGAGTGLGLALVHGIVYQNGGFIQVQSALEQGSTFDVYLPRCEAVDASGRPARGPRRGGNETILLVEDDAMAMRLTRRLLELLGYTVECAERGDRALQMLESGLKLDLLLTDILLPGLDGHSLYQQAMRLRPGLATVLMSGYTAEVLSIQKLDASGAAFLQKPFNRDELADKVRAALDARNARGPVGSEIIR